jgi:hypothetical protein
LTPAPGIELRGSREGRAPRESREGREAREPREPRERHSSRRDDIMQVETPLVEGRRGATAAALGGRVAGGFTPFATRAREAARELPALLLPPRYTVSK